MAVSNLAAPQYYIPVPQPQNFLPQVQPQNFIPQVQPQNFIPQVQVQPPGIFDGITSFFAGIFGGNAGNQQTSDVNGVNGPINNNGATTGGFDGSNEGGVGVSNQGGFGTAAATPAVYGGVPFVGFGGVVPVGYGGNNGFFGGNNGFFGGFFGSSGGGYEVQVDVNTYNYPFYRPFYGRFRICDDNFNVLIMFSG